VIPGIILAAGLSSRMGRPKALLPARLDGPTFVGQLARTLLDGGVADVIVVVKPNDRELADEVVRLGERVRSVTNPHAELGQLSSLLAGLDAADHPGVRGVLVTPVDAPFVRETTIAILLSAFASRNVPLVRATFRGRHGHPVIFGRSLFDALRRADPRLGAKAVVQAHAHEPVDVDVDDEGVLHDIDGPDDYARAVRRS
jgi:molybdenum cofactor cytidylyltransferase